MLLVPISPSGYVQWGQVFEVESLESWSAGLNKRMEQKGDQNRYWMVSPKRIEYLDGKGIVIMKYIACEQNPDNNAYQLLEFPNQDTTGGLNPMA
jgi:hypothetical protein